MTTTTTADSALKQTLTAPMPDHALAGAATPSPWKEIDFGPTLVTEAMEIPGRGVLVRCYNRPTECMKVVGGTDSREFEAIGSPPLVSLVRLNDVNLQGNDADGWKLV